MWSFRVSGLTFQSRFQGFGASSSWHRFVGVDSSGLQGRDEAVVADSAVVTVVSGVDWWLLGSAYGRGCASGGLKLHKPWAGSDITFYTVEVCEDGMSQHG